MNSFLNFIKYLNQIIWGFPMLFLLIGTHLFFTFRLNFIQKKTWKAVKLSVMPEDSKTGDLSSFATLTTTLAATIGTGNIIGVSTAVYLGGPGAILWCWLTGILGMATSYAECYLSFLYRKKKKDGTYAGGPMYVLEDGLHCKPLAVLFALFTLIASYGVGCSTQSNSITETTYALWGLSPYAVGFATAILTGFAIIGGIKKIGTICMKLVPIMGFFYIGGCLVVLLLNANYILSAFFCIIKAAFTPFSMAGGLIGGTISTAARYGIARGLFTNEAGLGSAGITAAAAKTKNPIKQALVSMTATFWDTVVMCAITGLVIMTHIVKAPDSISNAGAGDLTTAAFSAIPVIGPYMLGISLIAFAVATLLGWSYFGEKAVQYLFGSKSTDLYRIGYIVMIFLGAIMSMDLVWELSDLVNACMAVPNLIAILLLHKKIRTPE